MNHNVQRMKDKYNPDGGDIAVGSDGQFVYVTWAERALLEMIQAQQTQIDALRLEHQAEINALKNQVARLQEASPSGAQPAERDCPPRLDKLPIETDPATAHGLGELLRGE